MVKKGDEVILSQKEWSRLVDLIENEWSKDEKEIVEWINNDDHPSWQVEPSED